MTSLTRTNFLLQHEIDAASDPYDEKDSLRITTLEPRIVRMKEALRRIATLEVRIVRMEEALRSRDKIIDEKNALLKEKVELVATFDAALVTKNGVIEQLHHR